jgi:solute carrier family 25 thiamine pyrophosphate transporter 19
MVPGSSSTPPSWAQSLVCGGASGVFAKTVVYPLDFVKKRLQVQGFEEARSKFGATPRYNGALDCLVKVARTEGYHSLFKGYVPSLLKAAVTTAAHFAFYEQLLIILKS